jgi:hypothetical protein
MNQPSSPAPVATGPRRFLGITKAQMGIIYLVGVVIYLSCTFLIESTLSPVWNDLNWRDLLTMISLPLTWLGLFLYNRTHPDEEIQLNLADDNDSSS